MMNYFIKQTFMYQLLTYLVLLIMATSLGYSPEIFAEEIQAEYSLIIEPEQCVAMRQGQLCYLDVKMSWRAEQVGNYCLFSSLQPKALQCWSNMKSGELQQEMSASENIVFSLQKQGRSSDLIAKEIEMAWVYDKSTRKNISWRMF